MGNVEIKMFKPLEDWKSVDFVRYFYSKCEQLYGKDQYEKNWDKDCMIMKTVLTFLKEHKKTPTDVLTFMDWASARYKDKPDLHLKMQIGILKSWIRDYFKIPFVKKANKKKRKKIVLSDDTKKWIADEKKRIKALKKSGEFHVGF